MTTPNVTVVEFMEAECHVCGRLLLHHPAEARPTICRTCWDDGFGADDDIREMPATRRPMNTDEVDLIWPADTWGDPDEHGDIVLGFTCSTSCFHCGERIWFRGSWTDPEIPDTYPCPSCGQTQDKRRRGLLKRRAKA